MRAHRLNLTKIALLGGAAAFVITCADSPITSAPGLEGPMFAIADGGHGGGNVDVFFLEPLTDFDATDPNFGDRPPNPYLAPVARVCALNATEQLPAPEPLACLAATDPAYRQSDLLMTYDMTGGFYRANLKDITFTLDPDRMYRIEIYLGNRSLHAYRDVDPDEGPSVASCTDEPFCQFNSQGSGGMPIKVIIEAGAACYDPEDSTVDLDACATATLSAGESLALQDNGTTVGVAAVNSVSGGGSATISIQYCADLRDRASREQGRVDLPTFGECLKIENLDNPLEVFGTITDCQAYNEAIDANVSPEAADRMTVHRFSTDPAAGDEYLKVVALPHADAASCSTNGLVPRGPAFEFGPVEQLVRFARRSWRNLSGQVLALIQPLPAWACHGGNCAGFDDFRSDYQAAQSAWMGYHSDNPDGNLGTHDVGTTATGKVQAMDSGELDGSTNISMEPVKNVRLSVKVTSAYGSVSTSPIFTGADGIATFALTVGPGLNTVEVSGIGVGTDTAVFAPPMDDATADPVVLDVGTLTFTAIGRVPVEFTKEPVDVYMDAATGLATLSTVTVCTVGAAVPGVAITLVAVNNNGSWVELTGVDFPVYTDDEGCYTFDTLQVNKTGAYRLVANPIFSSQNKVVGGDGESEKFNVKPPLKK